MKDKPRLGVIVLIIITFIVGFAAGTNLERTKLGYEYRKMEQMKAEK